LESSTNAKLIEEELKEHKFITDLPNYEEDEIKPFKGDIKGAPYNKMISNIDIEKEDFRWYMQDSLADLINQAGTFPLSIDHTRYENNYTESIIMNLDFSDAKGSHWICLTFDNDPPAEIRKLKTNRICYSYDSFGRDILSIAPVAADAILKANYAIFNSTYEQQHMESYMCGYMALSIAKKIREGLIDNVSLTPKIFMEVVYKVFGDTPDRRDITRALKFA